MNNIENTYVNYDDLVSAIGQGTIENRIQQIEHVNEIKIKAYETFWLLKRKPLQLKVKKALHLKIS